MRRTNRMAKRLRNLGCGTSGRMAGYPRSAEGVCIAEKRCPEAGWSKGTYFSKTGLALHAIRVGREVVRHSHCSGQVRIRDAHTQSGLLQESGGARGRMEQQGPVLRPGLEQLSALIRSACH